MTIAFRAAASNEGTVSGTDVSVTIPAGVAANDGMIAVYTVAGTGATAATPSGWTLISGPVDKSTVLRSYAFKKVAGAGDAGSTLTVTKSVSDSTKRTLTLWVGSGTDTTDFIDAFASAVETTAGTGHALPTVTASGSSDWLVSAYADRGSPASTNVTPAAGYTERTEFDGAGGGSITAEMADSNGTVSSGSHGGDTFTGDVSTANAITWLFAVKAAGGSGATATPSTVTGLVTIGTPTIINGGNVTVRPNTVLGVVSIPTLVGQVSSTMFPDTVSGITTIPSPMETAVQTAVVIPDLTVAYAVTIGTPTIVIVDGSGGGGGGGGGGTPSTTRIFVGPTRTETWPLAPGARIAVKVTVNQTLYRRNGVWLVGENLNWADLVGVDRLYQGGATSALTDAQLDELIAEGQGQYVVGSTDPFASTFTGTF